MEAIAGSGAGITGHFITIKSGRVEATGSRGGAGIGGSQSNNSGDITIEGGHVTATGRGGGSGIGAGASGDCYEVTITGGTVVANGGTDGTNHGGAGIGGGSFGSLKGTVTIKGGTVTASGGKYAAGIGGGWAGNALEGHVNITGGKVTANGSNQAAGIGGGKEGPFEHGGEGSNVTISGNAEVFANSGAAHSSAIGHGDNDREFGTLNIADNMMVQADWTVKCDERKPAFTKDERVNACMYRWNAHIKLCDHPGATYNRITEKTHTLKVCKYCLLYNKQEAHSFDSETGKCTVCGYQKKKGITVTFHANGGTGRMDPQKLTHGKAAKLNVNAFTCRHHTFKEWNTEPDGSGKSYADRARVELRKNIDLYAIWYTNVTLVANSKHAKWTGEPVTVEGYHVIMPGGSTDTQVSFPGVSASRTETEPGVYPVEVKGAKVNETADKDGELLATKINDGELVIDKILHKITFDANGGKGEMDG